MGLEAMLTEGFEIGRDNFNFNLHDHKISGRHGVFRQNASGQWSFTDLGSKNGTFLNAQRVEKIGIAAGVIFRVGDTVLEVVDETKATTKRKTWSQVLEGAFLQARERLEDEENNEIIPFFRPLRMQIISGPQIDTSWIVAYGPRVVGQGSEEFPIYLDSAPEICFEIVPYAQGVKIINRAENFVFFNDSTFQEQSVLPGDRLKLGSLEIVMDYL